MQKIALRCDICDGPLTMQSGGKMAVCDYCGTQYAIERLREKIQEIRGKVSIEGTVKTAYEDFEIHAGVLTKYHGADTNIVIPPNVKEIAPDCFGNNRQHITSVTLPNGLQQINSNTFAGCASLKEITLPNSVTKIGVEAFNGCTSLEKINIPDSVTEISAGAFGGCEHLENVIISDEAFQRLCPEITKSDWHRSGVFIYYFWEWTAFSSAPFASVRITNWLHKPEATDDADIPENAPIWFRKIAKQKYEQVKAMNRKHWRQHGWCQYCGGVCEGFFTLKCKECKKAKDYYY